MISGSSSRSMPRLKRAFTQRKKRLISFLEPTGHYTTCPLSTLGRLVGRAKRRGLRDVPSRPSVPNPPPSPLVGQLNPPPLSPGDLMKPIQERAELALV